MLVEKPSTGEQFETVASMFKSICKVSGCPSCPVDKIVPRGHACPEYVRTNMDLFDAVVAAVGYIDLEAESMHGIDMAEYI